MPNSTATQDFVLLELSDVRHLQVSLATFLLLVYLATVTGNAVIAIVTTADERLHTPMYFFLRNLSVLDACYASVTVPKSCVNALLHRSSISTEGCVTQVFLVVFFVYVELLFLTSMARDRYVAICLPLHYPVLMSPRACLRMTLASLLSGLVYAAVHTSNTFRLPFCGPRLVHQLFCDIPSLLKLSCSDPFSNQVTVTVSGLVVGGGCLLFILWSYIRILAAVLRFPAGADRKKAFSTCIPHILVVSAFLGSGLCVYLRPSAEAASTQDVVLSVIYSIIPPLLNPVIYSLRNEQVKRAIQRILTSAFDSGNLLDTKEACPK